MFVPLYVRREGGQARRCKADQALQRSKLIIAFLSLRHHTVTIFYNCSVKQANFIEKNSDITFVRTLIVDTLYNRGGFNEYQQFMLLAKLCKMIVPLRTSVKFFLNKMGLKVPNHMNVFA